jgi:uncharacterized membrane protein
MNRTRVFLFLVLSMHIAGVLGLLSPWAHLFRLFTPIHLLATTAMLLYMGEGGPRYYIAAVAVALSTFFIEMAGVQTGFIFGDYTYGSTLGPKVMGTPLLIGVNWVLLAFCFAHLLRGIGGSIWVRAMLGATLMTGMDVFIEPVAIAQDFWSWAQGDPPLHNYLGWWFTAFTVFAGLFYWVDFGENKLAPWVWVSQLIFFLSLNILGQGA